MVKVNEEKQKFSVMLEDGSISEAELLSLVNIDSIEYAVYSIDNKNGTMDILASYVKKDERGYDVLFDINDYADRRKVFDYIKTLMN